MTDFFRFPSTPHLAWLGRGKSPRDDKLLSPLEMQSLLACDVLVEEKLDGANLGFSLDVNGRLLVQNRGQYLAEPYSGQFARLSAWLSQHGDELIAALSPELILFGEWCAARHSLNYNALPDWFLVFDVYNRSAQRFWSAARRNILANRIHLVTVPLIFHDHTSLAALEQTVMNTPSRYRAGQPLEGVVVRRDSSEWCEARAKLVSPYFSQSIGVHWRSRTIEWNLVTHTS